MKRLGFCATFFAAASLAPAATVVIPPGTGHWQTISSPIAVTGPVITSDLTNPAGTNSAAYWNNTSGDGPGTDCRNIGCYLTGTGFFSGAVYPASELPLPASSVWLGNDDGSAIEDVYFSGVFDENAQMLIEIAGQASTNWAGWHMQGVATFTSANYGTEWGVLFDGNDAAPSSVTFDPTSNFGLWFLSDFSAANFNSGSVADQNAVGLGLTSNGLFTESSRNTMAGEVNTQHFAFFAESAVAAETIPATFWIGIEDLPFSTGSDKDFNDMVLRMRVVPEPGYYVLLLAGMGAIFAISRKRKASLQGPAAKA